MLENIRGVLDATISQTRNSRSVYRGVSTKDNSISESKRGDNDANAIRNIIELAEIAFSKYDSQHVGVIPFSSVNKVFEVMGLHLTDEELNLLMEQLEIMPSTGISFPEVVDIATFCQSN